MKVLLSPSKYSDYELLLKIKRLPRYEIRGSWAIFPDEYASLIGRKAKARRVKYEPADYLFDYQSHFSDVAIGKRRFSLFWDCGLGKTAVQLEFARHCLRVLPKRQKVLVVSWLMIVPQFIEECQRFYGDDLPLRQIPSGEVERWLDDGDGLIGITNWDAFKKPVRRGNLGALVLDETSILKNSYGTIGRNTLDIARGVEWKLGGTGTPAPNDCHEYANHAVLMEACKSAAEFYGRYFVNRGETSNRWELREHAKGNFYRELSHWSVFLQNPATYGFDDNVSSLPPIRIHIDDVELTKEQEQLAFERQGMLFGAMPGGIVNRARLSKIGKGIGEKSRIPTRKLDAIESLINGEQAIVWCLYNAEQSMLEEVFPDAASIKGTTPVEERIELVRAYKAGEKRILISKPKILGFGLNLHMTRKMIFSGLQDSYESFYQAVKRANRIGSTEPLDVHIPVTEIERPMIETVLAKADRIKHETELQEQLFREHNPWTNGK